MRILGDLVFAGLGQLKNARIDNVAADPGTPSVGQVWYNTVDNKYRGFDGTNVITFASGGSTAVLQAEIDQLESEVGLDTDGNYVTPGGSNYLGTTTTVMNALTTLDTQMKTNADAIGVNATGVADNLAEINAIEAGAGLNTDGTFTAAVGTNYIGGATTLKGADVLLDTQIKANADAIAQNVLDIADRVLKAGDTMTGNLAFGGTHTVSGLAAPINGTDAATKNYVDNLSVGLTWKNAVDTSGATNPLTATSGDRFLNTTDGKVYTATATDTWDAGVAAEDGDAVFVKTDETGYVYSGSVWVQFTGLGQITAGVGLYKEGNQLHIGLGAGIAQLPTDEVGVDLHVTSALFLTVDGTAASSDTAAQLSLLLDGSTLSKSGTGLKVAAAGVTAAELATGVAGAGLTGGAGTALTVGAGTGIVVNADDVALDLTYADGRYINVDGDTMTGDLTLAGAPTTNLMAATKAYVDAVTTAMNASHFLFDSGVTSATSHVVTHNIGTKYCNVTVVDSNDKVIIPDSVTFDSTSQLTVTFSSAITCKVVVSGKYVA